MITGNRTAPAIVIALFLMLPLMVGNRLMAQGNPRTAQIALTTRVDKDSVILRWAPTTPGAWIVANRIGYVVERVRFEKNKKFDRTQFERLTANPLKPWTREEWLQRSPRDDNYAAIALQAVHGKAFIAQPAQGNANVLRNAADELTNRYGFSLFAADNDAVTADGLGLRFVDRAVKDGEEYIYRVFLAKPDSTYTIDTAYAVVNVTAFKLPPPPPEFTAEGLDGQIALRWKDMPGGGYSGYFLFRSEDGGKTYKRLNQNPFVNVTPESSKEKGVPRYTDTSIVNYRKYRYEVKGVTPFAELGSPASVESYGRDLTAPMAPQIANPVQLDARRVKLTWKLPVIAPDLAGFVVAKSSNTLGGYRQLLANPLSPDKREYIDTTANDNEPYYIVGAVDTAGNVAPSLPVYALMVDSIPPDIPKGLKGAIDSLGVVRLAWNLGPEPDIIGYRVLRANDPNHEFSQLTPTPWKDTTFVDTVNVLTLTRYVYYRIAAVDKRYNHSGLSPMLALKRPDKIAPEPPVFTDVSVSDSLVRLSWARSTSEDVQSLVLYRKNASDKEWKKLVLLRPSEQSYVDREVVQTVTYQYRIEAVDSSGLHSGFAMPVQGRPYDTGLRPAAENVLAAYDAKSGTITVRWEYKSTRKEKYWIVIYRAVNNAQLVQYRSVDATAKSFQDSNLSGKGTYRYAIKIMTATGGESPLSAAAQIEIKK
ncbi:MAG TPA: hypothetical protein VI758_11315 [Bacteroidota bacterium]